MIIRTEADMKHLGEQLALQLTPPVLVELIGDVGAGKTTLVKGLAHGLGLPGEVTSPSFTINQRYESDNAVLSHYDFYRLSDAGIMKNEILETLDEPNAIVVVEWAGAVDADLPSERVRVKIDYNDDGTRTVSADGVKL